MTRSIVKEFLFFGKQDRHGFSPKFHRLVCIQLDLRKRLSENSICHLETVMYAQTLMYVLPISTRVWCNENRSVSHFPATPDQRKAMLDDIKARLLTERMSLPR